MVFAFANTVQLFDSVAVISLVAYLLTRTRYSSVFIQKKVSVFAILFMSLVGGLLYAYGVLTGIDIGPYFISIQAIGSAVAGLIAGPAGGVGAGVIGLTLQYLLGYPVLPGECIVTLISGIISGLFRYLNKNEIVSVRYAFILGCILGFVQLFAGIRGVEPDFQDLGEVTEAVLDLFLPTIAGLCLFVFIINNLRREEENTRYSCRIEGELLAARDIQLGSLPPSEREWEQVSLTASLVPASYVGGDLYDYVSLDDGTLYFAIGDVSGKGVPAALLMSSTHSLLRSLVREIRDPSVIVKEINRSFLEDGSGDQFITLVAGFLDTGTGEIRYCNAGHPPPFIISSSGCYELESDGYLPAGVMEDEEYHSRTIRLHPGEIILLVSDGVTEAEYKNELFTAERVIDAVINHKPQTPRETVSLIMDEVVSWTRDELASDDCTVFAIGYNATQDTR